MGPLQVFEFKCYTEIRITSEIILSRINQSNIPAFQLLSQLVNINLIISPVPSLKPNSKGSLRTNRFL